MIMGAWGLGRKPKLPYDAEVEYLESTGTQYIDTGVSGVAGLHITASMIPLYPVTEAFQDYFGGSDNDNVRGYRFRNNSTTEYVFSVALGGNANYSFTVNQDVLDIDIASSVVVNGVKVLAYGGSTYPGQNIFIFSFNRNGVSYRRSKMRLYRFAIQGKVDLIPVRFTNELGVSEGAMFDRVSGQLFRNQGTGAFVIGPDK